MANVTLVSNHFLKPILKSPHRISIPFWRGTNLSSGIKCLHKSAPIKGLTASANKSLKLRIKDNVPKDFALIYKAPMEGYMRFGYPIVLATALTAPSLILYQLFTEGQLRFKKEAYAIPFMNPHIEVWIFTCSLLLCGAAIFAVIFKYPFRIYRHHHGHEYIGVFLSAFPYKLRNLHFKSASQVTFTNRLYNLLMPDCQYRLDNGKNVLMFFHYFRTPADLREMLNEV